ncbi:hypothetical protein GWI33_018013 [Rhynchophorus ferrugineus]|uniref:Uncharacterized protein n=1 Tax=Rhynchophorus ferrugineus TaxID=354439 RepID=A0A834HYM8_RHYFE|nr:hypothetical protein GWI33_018013 [Rhynchophorus ferrugineus]
MALFWNVLETSVMFSQFCFLFREKLINTNYYHVDNTRRGEVLFDLNQCIEEEYPYRKKVYNILFKIWEISKNAVLVLYILSILLKLLL